MNIIDGLTIALAIEYGLGVLVCAIGMPIVAYNFARGSSVELDYDNEWAWLTLKAAGAAMFLFIYPVTVALWPVWGAIAILSLVFGSIAKARTVAAE